MLQEKSEILVQYWGHPNVWHARYLLSQVSENQWVCVTPDNDVYADDLGPNSAEVEWVRARPPGHGVPLGIAPPTVYDFNPHPTQDQLTALVAEGRREAIAECGRQGIAVPPLPGVVVAGDGGAIGGGGVGVLVAAGGGPAVGAGGGAAAPPPLGAGGAAAAPPPGGAVVPGAAGAPGPGAVPPPGAAAPVGLGGLGALVAALGGPAAVPGLAGLAGGAALGGGAFGGTGGVVPPAAGGLGGRAAAAADGGDEAGSDMRIMAVRYSAAGPRHREFRLAVEELDEVAFGDWPVPGPRTTAWVLRFMLENAGTPRGWHTKWRADCKLQQHDGGVSTHESICAYFEMAACYDQLQLANIAHIECMSRELQMVEERWKERIISDGGGESEFNINLFLRGQVRGNLCICPALQTFLSDQVRAENAISKERRKAREERNLLRPPKGAKGAKDKDG